MSRDECFAQQTRAALRQLCRMLLNKTRTSRLAKPKGFQRAREKRAMEPNKRNCIT